MYDCTSMCLCAIANPRAGADTIAMVDESFSRTLLGEW